VSSERAFKRKPIERLRHVSEDISRGLRGPNGLQERLQLRKEKHEIKKILKEIPAYTEFKTGDELQAGGRQLAVDFPGLTDSGFLKVHEEFGTSTEGKAIDLLEIGPEKSKRTVMWVGTPHPNEAVGTLAIDFMSRYLCEHPEVAERLETKFIFIKNADPDGLELNEGWLKKLKKGEMDPLEYALGFYRPPYGEEFEWDFPIDYKTLHFSKDEASNESKMLKKAFDKYRPDFYYSLHNNGFGSAYFGIYPPRDELFSPLQQLIKDQDLTLNTGEPELPFMKRYADGMYKVIKARDNYDYFNQLEGDPADRIQGGARAIDYLQSIVQNAVCLMPEIPYFTADALKDNRPSGKTRRQILSEQAEAREKIVTFMEGQFNKLQEQNELPDSSLKHAVEKRIEVIRNFNAANQKEAEKSEYLTKVTKAEEYRAVQVESFMEVIHLGQVYQLALQAGEIEQAEEIKAYIEKVIDDINQVSPIKAVPLQKLVAVQVGAGLITQQHLAQAA